MTNPDVMTAAETEKEEKERRLTLERGHTTFLIGIHYKEDAKHDLTSKIKGLMDRDLEQDSG